MPHHRVPVMLALLVSLAALGCETERGIPHPQDRLHFPVTIAADPAGDHLYVVNSNFDLRYRTGAVSVIDLDTHRILADTTIGIGDFGGQLALYAPESAAAGDEDPPRLVGYVPSRSEGRLYWFEVRGGVDDEPLRLQCSQHGRTHAEQPEECDESYRIERVERKRLLFDDRGLDEDEKLRLADRPVVLNVGLDAAAARLYPARDGVADHLLVTNPRSGRVTAFQVAGGVPLSPTVPGAPASDEELAKADDEIARSRPGQPVLLESRLVSGGVQDVVVAPQDGLVYATNRFAGVLVPLTLNAHPDPDGQPHTWTELKTGTPVIIPISGVARDYGREMLLSPTGDRGYLAYRNPASVVVFDTRPGVDGERRNTVLGAIAVGAGPARLATAPSGPEGRELLYVICYAAEEIWVIDPFVLAVVDVIKVDGGPFDLAIVNNPARGRFRAYVSSFERDAVAVIDLDRESPFYHQVIAFIRGGRGGGDQ